MTDLFAPPAARQPAPALDEPAARPPGWRRPGDRDHVCGVCQGLAMYGLGDSWRCRAHVPTGFLPHTRAEGAR